METTYDDLATELWEKLNVRSPFWLGITGPPGAGKSTVSREVAVRLGATAVVIPMDGYHFYRAELDAMSDPVKARRRRGAPFTFNADKFVRDLTAARQSGTGSFPSFGHGVGDPIENDIRFDTSQHQVVIVEGNYLLLGDEPWCQLKGLFDETWFIDATLETIRERITNRFLRKGLSQSAAKERFETNDLFNARLVIEHSRCRANRVIESR